MKNLLFSIPPFSQINSFFQLIYTPCTLYANFNENKLKNVYFLIGFLKMSQEPVFNDRLPLFSSRVPILNRIQVNLTMGDEQLTVMTSSLT